MDIILSILELQLLNHESRLWHLYLLIQAMDFMAMKVAAFGSDGYTSSIPLSSPPTYVSSLADIESRFNEISYQKASDLSHSLYFPCTLSNHQTSVPESNTDTNLQSDISQPEPIAIVSLWVM